MQRHRPSKDQIIKIAGIAAVLLLFFSLLLVLTEKTEKELKNKVPSSSVETKENKATEPSSKTTDKTPDASFVDPYADEEIDPVLFYGGKQYKLKKNIESYLFIGVDAKGKPQKSEGFMNQDQSDVLMLVVADKDTKEFRVIQINRDTMAEIHMIGSTGDDLGFGVSQIAFAHTFGSGLNDSCEYVCEAVSKLLLESSVDHYMSLPMDCIGIITDAVGGVTVKIPYDMTSADKRFTAGSEVKLDSESAEKFIRARQGLPEPYNTNIYRLERQQTFLAAWRKVMVERMNADTGFALDLIATLTDYMVTDMDLGKLSDLASILSEYDNKGMIKIDGDNRKGESYMEFYCYEKSLQEAVLEAFYNEEK